MLIGKDSPLRHIPANLDRKQLLSFDAFRLSVEMADISFSRLYSSIYSLTKNYHEHRNNIDTSELISTFLDAWSVVDWVYRLQSLLKQMKGLDQSSTDLQLFFRHTEIETLRNGIQHLNSNINELVKRNKPALGVLNWVGTFDSDMKTWHCLSLVPGTLFDREIPFLNPCGKTLTPPIDLITLVSDTEVCLSHIMIEHVSKIAKGLEKGIALAINKLPKESQQGGASDMLAGADFS